MAKLQHGFGYTTMVVLLLSQAFLNSFKRARVEREDKHGALDLGAL